MGGKNRIHVALAEAEPGASLVDVIDPVVGVIGFDDAVEQVLSGLLRRAPATMCIVAPPGGGRTSVLRAIAGALAELERPRDLYRVCGAQVVGGRRGADVRDLRQIVPRDDVIAFDDLEVLLSAASAGSDLDLRGAVRSMIGRTDLGVVATVDATFLGRLEASEPELMGEMEFVHLPSLSSDLLRRVAIDRALFLSRHHEVALGSEVIEDALRRRPPAGGRAQPGFIVDLLDRSCVAAARRGAASVTVGDLGDAQTGEHVAGASTAEPAVLESSLKRRIKGQDHAVGAIAQRLALTSSGLDLRPRRPNGVFLLVGPTGTGKTEIARALAETLFGSEDSLIALDMSEYSDEAAATRLYGPPPGYIGSDQPEGWLTSRVMSQPASVVLLDEIEKADPGIWTAFLQVFEEGRLTDSRGRTALFGDTVIVMTSNIGAEAYSANPVGFSGSELSDDLGRTADAEVRNAVERRLPPEFLNRIDEVVMMRPLDASTILEIAGATVEQHVKVLARQGWELTVTPEALELIAHSDYDPAYGARHLHRNIERHLLSGLIGRGSGSWKAVASGDTIQWSEMGDATGLRGE